MPKINDESLDALAEALGEGPPEAEKSKLDLNWRPALNPIQQRVFDSKARYILAHGERGSGKSHGALHKLVWHAIKNRNANAAIIVKETGQAVDGGSWSKLNLDILPTWSTGNIDRVTGKRMDKGMGIRFTAPRLDNQTKRPYIWVQNLHGGWSKISMFSLFIEDHIDSKIKGKEISSIFFDEAQTTDSISYFETMTQQVGRYPGIPGEEQQTIYACNPRGPSHWIWKVFLSRPLDEETGHPFDEEKGQLDKSFAAFHVPSVENKKNLPDGYFNRIEEASRHNEIEAARMLRGEWVEVPSTTSIFRDLWSDAAHIRGDAVKGKGLLPVKGHRIILGYDLGTAHSSILLMQFIPTLDKTFKLVFDELNYVSTYLPYYKMVPRLIERLRYWDKRMEADFTFEHISDSSAFQFFRAATGSFDAADFEKLSREYVAKHELPEKYIIKLKPCPKGPGSVEARVRLTMDELERGTLVVSATCPKVKAMFLTLESEKNDRMSPRRSDGIHVFDSLSYPILYYGSRNANSIIHTDSIKPEFYRAGA